MNKQRGGIGADLSSIPVHTDWLVMTVGDVEVLEGRADFWGDLEVNSGRYLTKLDVTPFLWRNNLVLQTTQRVWYHPEIWETLRQKGIGRHPFRHCQHWNWVPSPFQSIKHHMGDSTKDSMNFCDEIYWRLNTLRWRNQEKPQKKSRSEKTPYHTCPYCSTGYETKVHDHNNGGIEIELNTLTNLGSCIESTASKWMTAARYEGSLHDPWHFHLSQFYKYRGHLLPQKFSSHLKMRPTRSEVGDDSFGLALANLNVGGDILQDHKLWKAVDRVQRSNAEIRSLMLRWRRKS
ncbi:hypothetical protein D6C80_09431 [Aureobasidium pullulans]|nr:hypothetical protein D6C80_09431 [Aureobasidium pullulans]